MRLIKWFFDKYIEKRLFEDDFIYEYVLIKEKLSIIKLSW